MTYLLRVLLPDRPGQLGALASALGDAGVDILGLDVVERGPDGAVDDILVTLSRGVMADAVVSTVQAVPGAVVESLKPYHAARDVHRDHELVDRLAAAPHLALDTLTGMAVEVFRSGWALLVQRGRDDAVAVLAASPGAPETVPATVPWLPLKTSRRMDAEESWVPDEWGVLGVEMAAAPVGHADRVVLLGRPGGPRFRASEVLRLAHLAGISATVADTVG